MRVKSVVERPKRRAKWFRILSQLADSSDTVIELIPDPGEYVNTRSLQAACSTAIKRYKFNLDCIMRNGQVFVVKPETQRINLQ